MSTVKTYSCILLLAASLFGWSTIKAQSLQTSAGKYYVEHFGEEEGLPQNSVNNILADKNGFLWIATESGISRFNGNRFLPVPVEAAPGNSNFTRIKNFYYKGKDTIIAFAAAGSQVAIIVNNRITLIETYHPGKYGLLFLGQHNIIPAPSYIIDENRRTAVQSEWNINSGSYSGTIYNKDTIAVTLNDGIGFYDSKGLVGKSRIDHLVFSRILYVDQQPIYIDTENYVNFYFPAGLKKRKLLPIPVSQRSAVFNNSFGKGFFCVTDSVLYSINISSSGELTARKILTNLQDAADIRVIYEKDSNTVVVGTSTSGMYVYKKGHFSISDPLPKEERDVFYVQQLMSDNETILTGTDKLFRNGHYIGKTHPQFLTHEYSLLKDSKEYYWYVFYDRLLRAKDIGIAPETMLTFKGKPGILFEDRQQRVWFSSDAQFGYFQNSRFNELVIKGLPTASISYMQQDETGRYLLGTGKGLFILDNETDHTASEIPEFHSLDIRFIWPEANGQTWVCTYGQGLFLMTKGKVISFPESDSRLAYVHCIIEDRNGYFWMPTNNGLFVTARRSLMAYVNNSNKIPFYYRFTKKNGFRTNEFNGGTQPAFLRLPNGEISLSSIHGLVQFDPEKIQFNFSHSPIMVDNIQLDSNQVLQQDEIDIKNTVSNISFSISNSFWGEKENELLEYQVVAKGMIAGEGRWLQVGESGKINLFSPSHGEYQLIVRKRTGLNENDFLFRTVNFYVLPKWYQTNIFYIAALVGIILIMYGIHFWRRRYYRRANRVLQEKVNAATVELLKMNNTLEKKVEERTVDIIKEKDLSQSIINSLPGVFFIFDGNRTHLLWNKNFETVTGYSSEELKQKKAGMCVEEEDIIRFTKAVEQMYETGNAEVEVTLINKAKKRIPFYVNGIAIIYEGKPCILGIGIDISERKKAEQEKEHASYLLNERIKELTTLYRAGLVLQREEKSIVVTLHDFVSILPAGWQYPDITAACIKLGEREFTTPDFRPSPYNQSSAFTTSDGIEGKIEVVYLQERPKEDEGPFLAEERNLIDMLADMLRIYFTRKEALNALQKSEANLHTIFNTTDTVYALMDVKFQIIAFNQRAADFSEKEFKKAFRLHSNFIDYFPADRHANIYERLNKVMKGNDTSYEINYPQADGTLNWYYVRMFPITNPDNVVFGMMMAVSDITEKKLMEQEIIDQKVQEQKKVIRAILIGEEKERNKIGQELHDNVNQILAGTKLYLGMARKAKEGRENIINESMELIDNAIEEIRALSKEKVTPMKKVNLEELLHSLIYNFTEASKIKTDFIYNGSEQIIEDDLKLNIYRIIQEQLNNILKHAMAKNIIVMVEAGFENILVSIKDDGKGFDVSVKKKGIGISNMINRVESFNGTININSTPGKGCSVEINIPF